MAAPGLMSGDHLQTLMNTLMTAHGQQTQQLLVAARAEAPDEALGGAAVGRLQPCILGCGNMKRFKKGNNWVKDAKIKMEYLGITWNNRKLAYIRSQAGTAQLLGEEAKDKMGECGGRRGSRIDAAMAHTFQELIDQTRTTLLEIVNRDRVVIDRIKIKLGDKSVIEFFAEVEDQVKLTRANMEQITEN